MTGAFVPITPGGTPLVNLSARTEHRAWRILMERAAHMPYPNKAAFIARGYTVEWWEGWEPEVKQ